MAYLRACICVAVFLCLAHICVGEPTCSELEGNCLSVFSEIFCDGTQRQHVPGCPDRDYYCCVPKNVDVCERLGGRCQNALSTLACGGTKDSSLCGDDKFTYCCIQH